MTILAHCAYTPLRRAYAEQQYAPLHIRTLFEELDDLHIVPQVVLGVVFDVVLEIALDILNIVLNVVLDAVFDVVHGLITKGCEHDECYRNS